MRWVAALLAAVAAVVPLSGCGDDGAEPGAPQGATLVLDFTPGVRETLLQDFDAFLRTRDILRFMPHARRRACGTSHTIQIGRRERLASQQGAEN